MYRGCCGVGRLDLLALVAITAFLPGLLATDYVVQVSGLTDDMQTLIDAAQVDFISSGYAGVGVEATISRVVTDPDVNLYSAPPAPMWQVLTGFAWDPSAAQFTVEYEALAGTAANGLGNYKRVLYFSKESPYAMAAGDGGNICLQNSGNLNTDIEECRLALTSNYVSFLPDTANELDGGLTKDYISDLEDGGSDDLVLGIKVVVTPIANTDKEKISITLSLAVVLGTISGTSQLGRPDPSSAGTQYYDVGIGILFWPSSGSKTVMFDEYRLVVDSANTFQVEKLNRYTLAEHVNYQIVQKDGDGSAGSTLRAARIEFLLAAGNVLHQNGLSMRVKMPSLYCTENSEPEPCFLHADTTMCDALETKIALISSRTCFTPHIAICAPQTTDITTGSGATAETRQLISATFPIPDAFVAPIPFNVEIHLSVQTTIVGAGAGSTPLLSLLNFESNVEPQRVCTDPTIQDYKPIDFVVGEIFGKTDGDSMVRLRQCTGSAHCAAEALYNDVGGTLTTQSMIQALAMLVVRPQYTAVARAYFEGQAHEARLDDMYIIHQVPEDGGLVTDISTHTGAVESATDADGRAVLDIPTDLTGGTPCLLEGPSATSTVIESTHTCVTTHDYDASGPLTRPQTLGQKVYEIQYAGSVFLEPTYDSGSPGIILSGNTFDVSSGIPVAIFIPSTLTATLSLQSPTTPLADVTITYIDVYSETIFDKSYKEYRLEFADGAAIPASLTLTISYSDGTTTHSIDATLYIDTADVNAAVATDQASLSAIYGSGVLEHAAMVAFQYDSARLTPDARDAGRYWVWPVYDWQSSVLGLLDTSTLIMAWSVGQPVAAPAAAPAPSGGRRLLELEPPARAADAKNYKYVQIHRAQEQTPALSASKIFSATKLADLGRACALLPDSRKLAVAPWRDVVLRALNCTAPQQSSVSFDSALSPHPACAGVIACEKTAASPRGCAEAVADAARAMHALQDWETPLTSQRNDSNHTVRFQESHAGFDVNDVGSGPAAVTLVSTDACDVAARYAAAARPPAVLDVVYDATVPPPMQAVVMAQNGSTACSLEALVRRLSPMRLLAVRQTRALFVSPAIAAAVQLHDVDTQSAFATTHAGTASSLHHQASYATLPRAVMAHLLEKHVNEPERVTLTCGGTALHEQIGMGRRRSMPKIRQTGF